MNRVEEMTMKEKCFDCRLESPPTTTHYTLIDLGWRLLRGRGVHGESRLEWRCGTCWKNHKAGVAAPPPPPPV